MQMISSHKIEDETNKTDAKYPHHSCKPQAEYLLKLVHGW